MKITNQNIQGLLGATADSGKVKAGASRPAAETDQLELSDRVRELASLKEQLTSIPPVRHEKVESLRRAIRNGTYKPDAAAVADRLVRRKALDPIPE